MNILLGDFNAKLRKEDIFKLKAGERNIFKLKIWSKSLDKTNDNGLKVVNFATSKNLVVKSTLF
jgi:hypothetical protein